MITLQSKKIMELPKNQSKPQSRYWTKVEHELFLEALEKFGPKDVKSISSYVGTRTPIQVRTHSQKYFLRLKKGANERTFLEENLYKKPPANPDMPRSNHHYHQVPPTDPIITTSPTTSTTIPSRHPSISTKSAPSNLPIHTPTHNHTNVTTTCMPVSDSISPHTDSYHNSPTSIPKTPKGIRSITQVISPVIKNNNLPFLRKNELVKKLVRKDISQSHSIVSRRFTKDDLSKLGYAMKVYKHIKDYSTKINCIQKHFFPKNSTEELHLFLTEFFSENPHAIHADFFLLPPSPYPCGNACENIQDDHPSKEINFEKAMSGREEDRYLDINVTGG